MHSGTLALGPAAAERLESPGESSRQTITVEREELREAVLRLGLTRHFDQTARPVLLYPQQDKLSTAWKLALRGPRNGLTSPVFQEVMSQHLGLPILACQPILGHQVGPRGGTVGPFGVSF